MVQCSQQWKTGKYQKFNTEHWNILMPELKSSSQTFQIAQEAGSYVAQCPEPWPEPQPESNWPCWHENQCGTLNKILLNFKKCFDWVESVGKFLWRGCLAWQKVNQGTRNDCRLCYKQVWFVTLAHTREERVHSSVCLPGLLRCGTNCYRSWQQCCASRQSQLHAGLLCANTVRDYCEIKCHTLRTTSEILLLWLMCHATRSPGISFYRPFSYWSNTGLIFILVLFQCKLFSTMCDPGLYCMNIKIHRAFMIFPPFFSLSYKVTSFNSGNHK